MSSIIEAHNFFNDLPSLKKKVPSELSMTYYLFAKEFGIGYKEFQDLPIPYIVMLLDTHFYLRKEEEKAQKRK